MRNCWDQATHQQPSATGVEGAGGTGGPGCGARGRWRGLAGLQANAPSHTSATRRRRCGGRRRDRRAWLRCPWAVAGPGRASSRRAERSSLRGRLAGGPPPTGTPSSPAPQPGPTAPGTPAAPHDRAGTPKGRVPQYPPPCRLTQPLPRRGSGRMILSPGDGDASTGTYRPRRPLPGPPRRSGRRSRCAQGAGSGRCSAWWPGHRARRTRSSRP